MPFDSLRPLIACLCAGLLIAPLPAQNTPPAAPPASAVQAAPQATPPAIQVTTRMVQVNVVVHKKGEPVRGLTKDDFEIFDAGVKQQVAALNVEELLPPAPAVPKVAPKVPNIFSNQGPARGTSPKAVTIILMDGLNTPFADQAYARQQLIKFLRTLTASDRVALYRLGTDLRILHDFTDDPQALLAALDRNKAHIGSELADSNPAESNTGSDELDEFLDHANQMVADFQNINRVRTTMNAIEAIAQHVSALPGRKNLVWISGGFPFSIGMDEMNIGDTNEHRTFSDEIEHATRAVTAAQLAIYPVDARGLIAQPDFAASAPTPKRVTQPPPAGPSKAMRAIQQEHDAMNIIAERTGGKAYMNSNDIKSAVRNAIDDSRLTYVLSYYPTHDRWDGRFHEVKVSVKRPGVEVRNRKGYFAFPELPTTEQSRKAALQEAAWSPLDATRISLAVRLAPDIPKKGVLRMLMVVDTHQLTLVKKDDRWVGTVDVVFAMQAERDKPFTYQQQTLDLNLTQQSYVGLMTKGLVLTRDFNFPDVAYKMRVVVRDAPSGNVGSLNVRTDKLDPVPVAATAPAAEGPAPAAQPAVPPAKP